MDGLRVTPSSVQSGKARYPNNEDNAEPKVANWRNNLTALSQYQNLLFIAYLDKIHVFKPRFPDQALSEKSDLIITLPKSRPGLNGYLDPRSGHSINHLIVGDLGNEEIVVVACDDGDIISYSTRSIGLAIGQVDARVEPWFLRNVGASAWGLAIHKQARLLAVSSNTHCVDVFAPALWVSGSRDDCNYDEVSTRRYYREPGRNPDVDPYMDAGYWSPEDRYDSTHVALLGHEANIPNIAFFNSDLDSEGRYLVSTDIDGHVFVWDIYLGATIFRHSGSHSDRLADTERSPRLKANSGWGVACLDSRTARATQSRLTTFGCEGQITGNGFDMDASLNISEGAHSVPDNSHWHPGVSAMGTPPSGNPADPLTSMEQASDNGYTPDIESDVYDPVGEMEIVHGGEDELEGEDVIATIGALGGIDHIMQQVDHLYAQGINHEWNAIEQDPADLVAAGSNSDGDIPQATSAAAPNISAPDLASELTEMVHSDETLPAPDHPHLQNHAESPSSRRQLEQLEDLAPPRKQPLQIRLPFELLQTTVFDIRLFNNVCHFPNVEDCESCPNTDYNRLIICEKPLHQGVPRILQHHGYIERLNMIAQLPELGIIAIGNQTGRVGIMTATWWEGSQQSGFKIQCVLPFRSQEEKGLRPHRCSTGMVASLMGMAIGPIQGQEDSPEPGSVQGTSIEAAASPRTSWSSSRRFRLLMVYSDHTILSYEISRPTGTDLFVT